ncbi:MAG: hypothetical protein JSS41_01730 [Proteobacteria bacterium]|nr:hypothetical protein [Pseudomonadota bacterium]
MKISAVLWVSALLATGAVFAAGSVSGLWTHEQFETHRAQIGKALAEPGGQYREIAPADQKKVSETLDRMEQRWQAATDGNLSEPQQVEMANDQEVVTTALTQASADSRVVCERVQQIGSNMPKNICKTVAQRKREMIQAQNAAAAGALESN